MRINQNISAMNTYSRLTSANTSKSNSLAKLSSGLRINKAGDDAAGLAISEKMRGQVGGLKQATRNAQDGISLIQTAEGALNETHSILNRMRDLAVQAASDTNTDADRLEIQKEMDQLAIEVTRIADTTQFNTMELLDGSLSGTKFHIGANGGQNIELSIASMKAEDLGVGVIGEVSGEELTVGEETYTWQEAVEADPEASPDPIEGSVAGYYDASGELFLESTEAFEEGTVLLGGIDVTSQTSADAAITAIDDAVQNVSAERSKLGSVQNRLDHTINNLTATAENLSAAESRIRDVDMAEEMMEFTKNNILSQAATSMLAQANQMPQSVLQLLQ